MSLLKTSVDSSPITIPFKVRMEPYLVESVCNLARLMREKGTQNNDISGLLFGTVEAGVRTIQALKTFADMGSHSELARRQRWEKAYQATAEEARNDIELSQYQMVGWFSFRTGSGLLSSDLVFHNQHFRKAEDVALILWRDGPSQMTAEVYSRSENDALTSDDYRWGSVRLSADIRYMSDAVELAMRTKLNDDSYLRTYENDEPVSHFEALKRRAEAVSERLFGFLNRGKEDEYNENIRGLIGDGRLPGHSQLQTSRETTSRETTSRETISRETISRETISRDANVPEPYLHTSPDVAVAALNRPGFSDYTKPAPIAGVIPVAVPEPAPPAMGAWPGSGSGYGTAPARIPERIAEYRSDFRFPEASLLPVPASGMELAQIGRAPRTGRAVSNGISGLPMVLRPPVPPKASAWPWTIGIFLLCSGLVFGFLALGGLQGDSGRIGQMMQSLFPGSGLNLRVRNEDDRLRLSWNQRNNAVASASDATLQIFDGQMSREVHLDGREVADGSVLYRPLTNDIRFRLIVRGEQGSASGSVRLLDGLASRQSTLDVSSPAQNALAMRPGETTPVSGAPVSGDAAAPALLRDGAAVLPPGPAATFVPGAATGNAASAAADPALSAYVPPVGMATTGRPGYQAPHGFGDVAKSSAQPYETPATIGTNAGSRAGGDTTGGVTINGWDPAPVTKSRTKARTTQTPVSSSYGDTTRAGFVAPRPLVQVMPNVRTIPAGTLPVRTRVAVKVSVDSYGRVTGARVTGAGVNSKVAAAALSAAKQWMFDPARDNGIRISSEHTIVFVLPVR
jgi:TonB family protein